MAPRGIENEQQHHTESAIRITTHLFAKLKIYLLTNIAGSVGLKYKTRPYTCPVSTGFCRYSLLKGIVKRVDSLRRISRSLRRRRFIRPRRMRILWIANGVLYIRDSGTLWAYNIKAGR